jgi:hypothetical protein
MQVDPYTTVGTQLEKAEVGPTSGPTWRLSHLLEARAGPIAREPARRLLQPLAVHLRTTAF